MWLCPAVDHPNEGTYRTLHIGADADLQRQVAEEKAQKQTCQTFNGESWIERSTCAKQLIVIKILQRHESRGVTAVGVALRSTLRAAGKMLEPWKRKRHRESHVMFPVIVQCQYLRYSRLKHVQFLVQMDFSSFLSLGNPYCDRPPRIFRPCVHLLSMQQRPHPQRLRIGSVSASPEKRRMTRYDTNTHSPCTTRRFF